MLPNGLTVIHSPRPGTGVVSFSLRVMAGSIYERQDEAGIAHLLEHIVFDGTEKYPTERELAMLIDEHGGFRNATTSRETIEYVAKVLSDDIENAFEYLSQIVMYPLIREESVEKQKKIIEQEIYRFKSDPEKYAARLIYSVIFPDVRAGGLITGEVADVKKIGRDKIRAYIERTHCAKNMVLAICGNIDNDKLREFAAKYFANMHSGEPISLIDLDDVQSTTNPLIESRENPKQAILAIGYRGLLSTDQDRYALELLFPILARGKTSRLVYEIREKRALAYMTNAYNMSGRNMGAAVIQIGLAESNLRECIRIIKEQLMDLVSNVIPEDEIRKSLAFIKAGLAFNLENSLAEASFYSNMLSTSGVIRSIDEELVLYDAASKDPISLKKTAARIFSSKPSVLAIGSQGLANSDLVW